MHRLEITIKGTQGAGKTQLAEHVAQYLRTKGFTIRLEDGEYSNCFNVHAIHEGKEQVGHAFITTEQQK